MKKTLATSLIALLAACGGDSDDFVLGTNTTPEPSAGANATTPITPPATTPGTQEEGAPVPGTELPAEQAAFLASVYQANLDEIALAQLAVDRTANDGVRRLAQRLLVHHGYLNEQIAALNTGDTLAFPDEPSDAANTRVQQFTALGEEEFDRAYASHVLQHHEQALAQFRAQAPVDELTPDEAQDQAADEAQAEASSSGANASSSSSASASTNGGASATATGDGANGTSTTNSGNAGSNGDDAATPASDIELFALDALPALQVHLQAAKALSGAIDPAAYLVNMYRGGLAEIRLGQLALQQSENTEVRAFAQRMIDDHTQANEQIAAEAQDQEVSLPDAPGAEEIALEQELARMTGVNFDKAYMNHNVIAHEIAVAQTRGQIENAGNAEVVLLATTMLPALQAHLESAELLYESIVPDALVTAFAGGAGEILVSQLALQLSTDADVRQFASALIAEHRAANEQARLLARQVERELPSEVDAAAARAYVSLSQESAEDFDLEFLERNVALHQRAVRMVESAPADESNAEVQAFATELLAALREHLQRAGDLLEATDTADEGGAAGGSSGTSGTGGTGATGGTTTATP